MYLRTILVDVITHAVDKPQYYTTCTSVFADLYYFGLSINFSSLCSVFVTSQSGAVTLPTQVKDGSIHGIYTIHFCGYMYMFSVLWI